LRITKAQSYLGASFMGKHFLAGYIEVAFRVTIDKLLGGGIETLQKVLLEFKVVRYGNVNEMHLWLNSQTSGGLLLLERRLCR
jgi:hypothetical protein